MNNTGNDRVDKRMEKERIEFVSYIFEEGTGFICKHCGKIMPTFVGLSIHMRKHNVKAFNDIEKMEGESDG